MAYDGRYDDPRYINAFLAEMRLSNEEPAPDVVANHQDLDRVEAGPHDPSYGSTATDGFHTPGIASAASSPQAGIRAPPPTPESTTLPASSTAHLSPIEEGQEEGGGKRHSSRSKPSPLSPLSSITNLIPPPMLSPAKLDSSVNQYNTPGGESFSDSLKNIDEVKNYHEQTLARHKALAEARVAERFGTSGLRTTDHLQGTGLLTDGPKETCAQANNKHLAGPVSETVNQNTTSHSTEPSRDVQDEPTVHNESSDDDFSSIEIIVDTPDSPQPVKPRKSVVITAPTEKLLSFDDEASDQGKKPASHADDLKGTLIRPRASEQESREHATYFESWGLPKERSSPPSRIRKVILTQLPMTTNFSLVQSLIHGGAIDEMTLIQSNNAPATAHVLFTNADACDKYYDAYPNGLVFKHNGKRHVALVDKGTEVNVISSVLQSYLDCGATRVLRATGVDEDWSMKALRRIAIGKSARTVEAIIDTYRNESRTVIFRFTKIFDAVAFRQELFRDPEWMDEVDFQFVADPCEHATDVHWD